MGDGLAAGFGGAGGGLADGHLAGAGFHVAEQAESVVGSEDLFLGEVAVEVEAVEAELLGLRDFLHGQLWCGVHAVDAPEAPGDGGVDLDAAAVEAEDGVFAEAFGGEGAEAEGYGAGVTSALRSIDPSCTRDDKDVGLSRSQTVAERASRYRDLRYSARQRSQRRLSARCFLCATNCHFQDRSDLKLNLTAYSCSSEARVSAVRPTNARMQ